MRIAKTILVIGLALLMSSFISGNQYQRRDILERDEYAVHMVKSKTPLSIRVDSVEDRYFSLYVLNMDDTKDLVREESMMNVTPLLAFENITSFSKQLNVNLEWCGITITCEEASLNINVEITVRRAVPNPSLFYSGLLLSLTVVTIEIVILARKYMNHGEPD
ncbi:MAG: hypothetical protein ACOC3C_04535 [Candidatus Thorarchaeota archaeon]